MDHTFFAAARHPRHESHECAQRRIRCVQCGEPDIPFGRLEEHLRECPHYEVNRLRADVNALRQTIVDAAAASQRAIDALTLALQHERGEREAAHAMALQIIDANRSAHGVALAAVQRASEQAAAEAVGVATAVQDEWRRTAAQVCIRGWADTRR